MGDATIDQPVFARGSAVLDYWLVHAEGLTVEPLGARVGEVVMAAPAGRPARLIVRSPRTRRRRTIDAGAISAVEPAGGTLLLDTVDTRGERARVARASAVRFSRSAAAGTAAAAAWTRPRAARAASTAARHVALGTRWLAPRVVASSRFAVATAGSFALAAAVITARAAARAAHYVEGVAERRRRYGTTD